MIYDLGSAKIKEPYMILVGFLIGFCPKYAKHQAEISSVFAGHIIESKVHGGHFGKQNNSMSDILVIFRNN